MLRIRVASIAVAAAGIAAVFPASAEDSVTTRIEPQNVYGATITIEEGVRVFRPLPSERHVIVNPHGMTPLSLGFYDPRFFAPRYAPGAHDDESKR